MWALDRSRAVNLCAGCSNTCIERAPLSVAQVSSVGYCHYNSATKTYSPITRANFVGFYHLVRRMASFTHADLP